MQLEIHELPQKALNSKCPVIWRSWYPCPGGNFNSGHSVSSLRTPGELSVFEKKGLWIWAPDSSDKPMSRTCPWQKQYCKDNQSKYNVPRCITFMNGFLYLNICNISRLFHLAIYCPWSCRQTTPWELQIPQRSWFKLVPSTRGIESKHKQGRYFWFRAWSFTFVFDSFWSRTSIWNQIQRIVQTTSDHHVYVACQHETQGQDNLTCTNWQRGLAESTCK